jgi:hypothetical protein
MATVWDHLSVEELEELFVGCDATASRHFQVIWLLARGHTISQVSGTTAYGERWIEQLLARARFTVSADISKACGSTSKNCFVPSMSPSHKASIRRIPFGMFL